jgi:hypothetical protein
MKPLPLQIMRQQNKLFHKFRMLSVIFLGWCSLASAQHWTPVTPFPGGSAGTALLRTDGNVMVQESDTGQWWELVPDVFGNYSLGTWFPLALAPAGYAPRFYGSAVLPTGKILFEGGEYNSSAKDDTTKGAIYNEVTNSWKSISPPSGWTTIGDAPTVVLRNGRFMMGDCCSKNQALFDAKTLTWSSIGGGKADANTEEGWTLLPNGKVLTVDTNNGTQSELFDPTPPGTWSLAGSTIVNLTDSCGGTIYPEVGPAVLRPNGTVFAAGASGKTAIYNWKTSTWSAGPSFPSGLGVQDGPAALLASGHVLVMAGVRSPCMSPPSSFFEFDGTNLNPVPAPPNAVNDASYHGHMLVLPNGGHILFTDGTSDVEVYIPAGPAPKSSWLPTITSFPLSVTRGDSYTIQGTQFNGLSQGAAYGDDVQTATNFPLVRMTDTVTGFVYYARTSNFSTMGVATGSQVVSATFVPPTFMPPGLFTLEVVANGLASAPVFVSVV